MARLYSIKIENDEFHKKIGGGLPVGTLALIVGDHGCGKSVLCQRLVFGLLKNDVTVSYISTQLTTIEFIKQMLSMGYDIIPELIRGKLSFFPVYPLINEIGEKDEYSKKLISSRQIFEKEVVVIDSFSSLIKFDVNPELAIELVGFFKRITASGKVIILTVLDGELPEEIMEEMESAASLLIETSVKKIGTDLKNVMTIKKYNFAVFQYSKQTAFRVEPKIGLVVEIAAVA
ncbi:MAG TPA: flagellar accessory protein FlaH [Archaeoglobus sp.]|nr:flagellar accessory protein FlaH [Archaeoglobus sp.]